MRAGGLRDTIVRAFAALSLCALSACASNSYMGIPLAGAVATPEQAGLRSLAARAQAGDKHAQLELGIAFEEGWGVRRDWGKAERLYRLAAAQSGGTTWVYSPPVREGASGRVIPVNRGPVTPGLEEASQRLAALRERRVAGS